MTPELQKILDNIKSSTNSGESLKPEEPAHRVFTISGTPGAGSREVIDALARKLDLQVFDKAILYEFVKLSGIDEDAFTLIADSEGHSRNFWLYRLLGAGGVSHEEIRKNLSNVMYALARAGNCIIVGRGGHVPLADIALMRIRITASFDNCIKRIEQTHGLDHAAALAYYKKTNASSGRFLWNIFNSRLNEPTNFDMVINTDRGLDPEFTADMIAKAAENIERMQREKYLQKKDQQG